MRDTLIERLFGLFTSRDHAEAIAGDLLEERNSRGSIWFWPAVFGITLVLWRNAVREAPLRVLSLAATSGVLLIGPAFVGTATVSLFPQFLGAAVSWAALSAVWCGGAMWTGASVVNRDARHGMAACACVAASIGAVLAGVTINAVARGAADQVSLLFPMTGLLAAASMPIGGAIARARLSGSNIRAEVNAR